MKHLSSTSLRAARWGSDLDGVLAVKPPVASKPWSRMNGPERRAQREATLEWYRIAEPLGEPDLLPSIILSARKDANDVVLATREWLDANGFAGIPMYLLNIGRTIKNVAEFKVGILHKWEIDAFVEDNRAVLKAMAALRPKCSLWFWDKDSPAAPELFYSPDL